MFAQPFLINHYYMPFDTEHRKLRTRKICNVIKHNCFRHSITSKSLPTLLTGHWSDADAVLCTINYSLWALMITNNIWASNRPKTSRQRWDHNFIGHNHRCNFICSKFSVCSWQMQPLPSPAEQGQVMKDIPCYDSSYWRCQSALCTIATAWLIFTVEEWLTDIPTTDIHLG